MAKSKALAKAEGKLKQLHKAVKDMEKRVKLLTAKEAKAAVAKKKTATKKKVTTKKKTAGKKKVVGKKKVASKKKAAPKKTAAKKIKTKKAHKVAVVEAAPLAVAHTTEQQ